MDLTEAKRQNRLLKGREKRLKKNGWTLWSFQFRYLELWFQEIKKSNANNVIVFCSDGRGSNEPKGETKKFTRYKTLDDNEFKVIPNEVVATLHSNKKGSAFIVKNIIYPTKGNEKKAIEWLEKNGKWRTDKIPTIGQYLIKPGPGRNMGNYRAILELQYPYIAEVGI